jgi:hypothetical protein
LAKEIKVEIEFLDELPRVNTREVVLIKKQYENDLIVLKNEFIDIFTTECQKINRNFGAKIKLSKFTDVLNNTELNTYNSLFAFTRENTICSELRELSTFRFSSFVKYFLYWLKDKGVLLWNADCGNNINIMSLPDYVQTFFVSDVGRKIFEYKYKNKHFMVRPNVEIFLYVSISDILDFSEADMNIIEDTIMKQYKDDPSLGTKVFGHFRKFIAFYNPNIDTVFTYRKKKRDIGKKSVFEIEFLPDHSYEDFKLIIEDMQKYLVKKEKIDNVVFATIREKKTLLIKFLEYWA